eukprot:TCALIF_00631-PA protein Name:"Protein of unknown function" AED:0.31 eAED:0.31 QI:0/0.25/0/0.44/1/1/9/0/445
MALLDEMERNPLSKNPFFATIMGGQFTDNGQEGIEPGYSCLPIASSGYFCKMLGNLECSDFSMQCEGRGVIDCTGQCPGDLSVLEDMFQKLESAEFMADYPLMAEMMNKSRQNQDKDSGSALKDVLVSCGFTKYLALLDGPAFGEATNSSVAAVDEEAVSGFGDYSYEDYEDEPEKSDYESLHTNEDPEVEPEAEAEGEAKAETEAETETDFGDTLNLEDEETIQSSRQLQKDTDEDFSGTLKEMETLEKELHEFRGLLKIALDDMVSPNRGRVKRHLKYENTLQEMRQILTGIDSQVRRYTRSLMENDTERAEPEGGANQCIVRNLTCVRFPTIQECSGIGVGGCVTRSQALAILFAPRVIIVIVAVILVLIVAIGGVAYYLYKRKRMNLVEPIEINGNTRPEGMNHHSTDVKHKLVKQVPFNHGNAGDVNHEPDQERNIQTHA